MLKREAVRYGTKHDPISKLGARRKRKHFQGMWHLSLASKGEWNVQDRDWGGGHSSLKTQGPHRVVGEDEACRTAHWRVDKQGPHHLGGLGLT